MLPQKKPTKALYIPPALRNCINPSCLSQNCQNDLNHTISLETNVSNIFPDSSQKLSRFSEVNRLQENFTSLSLESDELKSFNPPNSQKSKVSKPTCAINSPPKNENRTEPSLNYDDFRHVIELYDFPKEFESYHLEAELNGFKDSGFYLKWVDDNHCLVVFSSNTEAAYALSQISGILMKARTIEKASLSSKWKLAKSPGDWAMPFKKRPLTNCTAARRMISSHLGISSSQFKSPEDIQKYEQEKKMLLEARAHAEALRKAQKSMWEDDW